MEGAGPWGWPCLLLLLKVSGFQAVDEEEKQIYLQEGRNLTVSCVYNIMLFSSSLKAWQRVESQGPPETLVRTSTRNLSLNQARAGRYLLEDRPSDAVMMVTITELQPQDLGLYQCVIYLSPQNFHLLLPRIRLTQYEENGTSSRNPTPKGNPDSGPAGAGYCSDMWIHPEQRPGVFSPICPSPERPLVRQPLNEPPGQGKPREAADSPAEPQACPPPPAHFTFHSPFGGK
ncbi:triggering receptor expressed on myeloid cells 3 isoform X2 [Manis pentadactyla]|uniref:triggering receptor expressed on myeloid cells 3 isoform X2 n=1 Tax=Manis pentadactyla TaxID=143292 RepID=UPI00255CB02D|nr:triggering receptor expressed on myeloid cells 3 isoform X2 [Manis pentadactyla]